MKEYKCKDCIHYCVCKDTVADENWTDEAPKELREMYSPKNCETFLSNADVTPVVHAKWKLNNDGSGTCSNCHFTQPTVWDMDNWQSYCGVCGARMDGGNK